MAFSSLWISCVDHFHSLTSSKAIKVRKDGSLLWAQTALLHIARRAD